MPDRPADNGGGGSVPDPSVNRRGFMKIMGVAGAAGALPTAVSPAEAQTASSDGGGTAKKIDHQTWLFFNSDEAQFITAAADTLIPSDDVGPGAVEVGVPTYIDRQLAGDYGAGGRLYLEGPFSGSGAPEQGYQLPLTPAELIRTGIADVTAHTQAAYGKFFQDMPPEDRAALISGIEKGQVKLASVPGKVFFSQLLQLVNEGYFADPEYGGNKDKLVWKMLGFPGAGVIFTDKIVAYRNKPYRVEPKGIADLG